MSQDDVRDHFTRRDETCECCGQPATIHSTDSTWSGVFVPGEHWLCGNCIAVPAALAKLRRFRVVPGA